MLALTFAAASAMLMAAATSMELGPTGQIILDNGTSSNSDLYVDGAYQCHAVAHSSCIAEVSSGIHIAKIRFESGDYIVSNPIDVPADMSMTLPARDLMT